MTDEVLETNMKAFSKHEAIFVSRLCGDQIFKNKMMAATMVTLEKVATQRSWRAVGLNDVIINYPLLPINKFE